MLIKMVDYVCVQASHHLLLRLVYFEESASFQNGPSPVPAATGKVTSYTEDPLCKCLRG